MLSAPLFGRRSFWPTCTRLESLALRRAAPCKTFTRTKTSNRPSKRERDALKKERAGLAAEGRHTAEYRPQQNDNGSNDAGEPPLAEAFDQQPSLIEQLFPEENEQYRRAQASMEREIPRLPLDRLVRPREDKMPSRKERLFKAERSDRSLSPNAKRVFEERRATQAEKGEQTSVLVLRKASKNLTIQDFRRLIPQGQHMEGWNLDQGSIISVIPGRDLATLEHQGWYYLLFHSELSAFVYQGHATRISRLVSEQTPSSLHNSLPPPPGYMLNGMDVDAAIQAYTLTPPMQKLDLRQLKRPLTPMLEAIVRYGGYPALVTRSDKMPFELRLTLEGPQLTIARIRHILRESMRDRALGWSGGEGNDLKISQWEPIEHVSDMSRTAQNSRATQPHQAKADAFTSGIDVLAGELEASRATDPSYDQKQAEEKRRTPNPVYILGFHTEHAAQSFMRHWHRRPMEWGSNNKDEEGDIPPVAIVEALW